MSTGGKRGVYHRAVREKTHTCLRSPLCSVGQPSTMREGNAHTYRARGTGTNRSIDTHLGPKQRITCALEERTASR
jgi:hypothetical protein